MFAALCGFGLFFGFAFCGEICGAATAAKQTLSLSRLLLFVLLPAFLYSCCMAFCAYERRAFPLWGLCAWLVGVRYGMAYRLLLDTGFAWLALLFIPLFIGQAVLALVSLDCRRQMSDAYAAIERMLIPATAFLTVESLVHLLLNALILRMPFH